MLIMKKTREMSLKKYRFSSSSEAVRGEPKFHMILRSFWDQYTRLLHVVRASFCDQHNRDRFQEFRIAHSHSHTHNLLFVLLFIFGVWFFWLVSFENTTLPRRHRYFRCEGECCGRFQEVGSEIPYLRLRSRQERWSRS